MRPFVERDSLCKIADGGGSVARSQASVYCGQMPTPGSRILIHHPSPRIRKLLHTLSALLVGSRPVLVLMDKGAAWFSKVVHGVANRRQVTEDLAKPSGGSRRLLRRTAFSTPRSSSLRLIVCAPSLNHGPIRGSAEKIFGEVQLRNAEQVTWNIIPVDDCGHSLTFYAQSH